MSRNEYRQRASYRRKLSRLLKFAYGIPDRTIRQRAVATIQTKMWELDNE